MRRFRGSFSGHEFNHLFVNQGPESPFLDAAFAYGLASTLDGRAVAAFDMDGNGLQDLVIQNLQGLKVLQNRLPGEHNYIELSLLDADGFPAVGAEVTLEHSGRTIRDRVRISAGFHTQVNARLHLGLGQSPQADVVRVRWPAGKETVYRNLASGTHHILQMGEGAAVTAPRAQWDKDALPSEISQESWAIDVPIGDGMTMPLTTPGQPKVVNLWAPWCATCRLEGPDLNVFHSSDAARDLPVLGLLVGEGSADELRSLAKANGLQFPMAYAHEDLVKRIYPSGEIKLPTTLIFDEKGQLIRRINRRVTEADLRAYSSALALRPTRTDLLRDAELKTNREDFSGAYDSLLKAEAIDPHHIPTLLKQIDSARRLGRPDFMIRTLTRLTTLLPNEEKHWLNLIEQTLPTQGPRDTLRRLKNAPDIPGLIREKARLHLRLGERDEAVKVLRAGLAKTPNEDSLLRMLEQTLRKQP